MAGEDGPESTVPLAVLSRRLFRRWTRLTGGYRGVALMFAWAVAEATVWPIIPDFLLLPVAITHRRRHIPLFATILGSALGGAAWHVWASLHPEPAIRALLALPLVRVDQIQTVRARIERSGSSALFTQPWSGIGLKVWAPVAAAQGIPAGRALLFFTIARTLRLGLVSVVAAAVTRALRGRVERLAAPLAVVYLSIFFPMWWRIATRRFPNGDV